MSKRTLYTVHYGNGDVARFSNRSHAYDFARSRSLPFRGGWAEVQDRTGLIGQYVKGITTEEFRHHHEAEYGAAR